MEKEEPKCFPTKVIQSKKIIGKNLELVSNHFPLKIVAKKGELDSIFVYSFQIEPEIGLDNRKRIKLIVDSLEKQLKEAIGRFILSGWVLFSNKKASSNATFLTSIKDKNETTEYSLSLKLSTETSLDNLNSEKTNKQRILQFFNILIKKWMRQMKMVELDRNSKFYLPSEEEYVEGFPLKVWTGFKTAIDLYAGGPMLLIDFTSRVIRTMSVLEIIEDLKKKGYSNEDVKEWIVGTSVLADYGNYRKYVIDDIDFKKNAETTFPHTSGMISYKEYYKNAYKINLKIKNQPLLISINPKDNKQRCLIPEICKVTGLTDEMKSNGKLMRSLAEFTKKEPSERNRCIMNQFDKLNGFAEKDESLIQFQKQCKASGFLLSQPTLELGKGSVQPSQGDFKREMRVPIYEPAAFKNWVLIYTDMSKYDYQAAENLVKTLQKCAGAYGINVSEPDYIDINTTNAKNYESELRKKASKSWQMVVSLISDKVKVPVYNAIKKVCINELEIPSQNVLMRTMNNKGLMSVCSNILLQMNVKLGKPLWLVKKPKAISERTMLVGADVFHGKGESVIGFCATMDSNFSKYFSRTVTQKKKGEEIMVSIGKLVEEAITNYFIVNKKKFLPDTIIFYRDGVGESQFESVQTNEIKNVKAAFVNFSKKYNVDYNPKFIEIIVVKRINDRFFSEESQETGGGRGGRGGYSKGGLRNPDSGTFINSKVVNPEFFNFFMIAQKVTQGTCTPTHYVTLYNDTNLDENTIYELTFSQCFNYYNWQGAVKVPALVQYCTKLAYFVGQHLKKDPKSQNLANTLYFL